MDKPFDTTTRDLIEMRPEDWLALVGFPAGGKVSLIDANLSTARYEADKVIRVDGLVALLIHLELQSTYDPTLPMRLLRYNVLLDACHDLLTRSIAILLRKQADGPALTGRLRRGEHLTFDYDVLRIWQVPVERILDGGLSTLPLAPLADLGRTEPKAVIRKLDQLLRHAEPAVSDRIWNATWMLSGLRYPSGDAFDLFDGVRNMKESSTYQAAVKEGLEVGLQEGRKVGLQEGRKVGLQEGRKVGLNEGLVAEARNFVLLIGRKRLGEPDGRTLEILRGLDGREPLEEIGQRILDARDWAEALGPFGPEGKRTR